MWVSQKMVAQIFDIDRTVITRNLKNIFQDGELDKNQVCAKFAHTVEEHILITMKKWIEVTDELLRFII